MEDGLERAGDEQQILVRSSRESVADLVEQYRSESRRYRRVHNGLQILVMTGSADSTTVAAFGWGSKPTWQRITLTGISFSITLASAFTGYYKYRERSYFLQQTTDSIEEHLNALALGVGEYARFARDKMGHWPCSPRTLRGCETSSGVANNSLINPPNEQTPEARSRVARSPPGSA